MMIYKGCQKKMIKVKDPGSKYFEEAYFILKEDYYDDEPEIKDMLDEANRIISDRIESKKKKSVKMKAAVLILSGAAFSSFLMSVIMYIIK